MVYPALPVCGPRSWQRSNNIGTDRGRQWITASPKIGAAGSCYRTRYRDGGLTNLEKALLGLDALAVDSAQQAAVPFDSQQLSPLVFTNSVHPVAPNQQ